MTMDESTKKMLLFMGVVVLLGLIAMFTIQIISDDKISDLDQIGNDLYAFNEGADTIIPEDDFMGEAISSFEVEDINPDFIQKGSIKISVERVYIEQSSEDDWDLYFVVTGEDLISDEAISKEVGNFFYRSPFSWSADLLKHRKVAVQLLTCDSNTNGRLWNITYCINADALDVNYFGQTTRLVFTDQSLADVQDSTLLALTRDDRTFVFEIEIPKEFYAQLA